MWCARLLMFFLVVGGLWRHVRCTCVLESEFGFTLNCAFKKSGLFRVRNLGGIKAHVGLGFTVGDELGFPESLSNVEFNRRRSSQTNGFQNVLIAESMKNAQNNQNNGKLTVRQPVTPRPQLSQQLKPQMPPQLAMAVIPAKTVNKMPHPPMEMTAFTVPPFKPIPPAQERPSEKIPSMERAPVPAMAGIVVPFQSMPSSISRVSSGNTVTVTKGQAASALSQEDKNSKKKLSSSNLALRTLPTSANSPNSLTQISLNTIQTLAANSNISVEAIEAAIQQKQQQLMKQQQQQQIAVTTTKRPVTAPTKRPNTSSSKVMNAPKEYYPVGYDKNFDDNFASRVELPDTSFYCGDQKHFPGLYADEDLGCMVFHVCALTDDGLIMKSFLCPESTLFDQTILKCNWWFYVDCKNSKKLYDSNIPISKSYQLMKALTFFSSYKKDQVPTDASVENKN